MPSFDAVIEEASRGGALVRVPDDVVTELGDGGRIAVVATFDGVVYRGSVVSMGGAKVIGVLKSIQGEIGKGPSDTVTVTLERDDTERRVAIPGDLRDALEAAGLEERFRALSYTRQREHARAVESARRADTRSRRIESLIDQLRGTA